MIQLQKTFTSHTKRNRVTSKTTLILTERIQQRIFFVRNKKIMLDKDLALLYDVETRTLNQAVKRNARRFPEDFMFQLTKKELTEVITNCDNLPDLKFNPSRPYAFTEHGILMLSSVLNSEKAIEVNIQIMRTFTQLRALMATHKDLQLKITALEKQYNRQFKIVFEAIRKLIEPSLAPQRQKLPIGFHARATEETPSHPLGCCRRQK